MHKGYKVNRPKQILTHKVPPLAHRFRDVGHDARYKTCELFGMARDTSGVVRWSSTLCRGCELFEKGDDVLMHKLRDVGHHARYKTCELFGMAARDASGVVRWSSTLCRDCELFEKGDDVLMHKSKR